MIKLTRRYTLKLVQAYVPTPNDHDEEIELSYDDAQLAIRKVSIQLLWSRRLQCESGRRQVGKHAIGSSDIDSRTIRGKVLVEIV